MPHIEDKRIRLTKGTRVYSRAREMEGYIISPMRVIGTKENLIAVRYADRKVFIHSLEKDVDDTIYPIDMYRVLAKNNQLPKTFKPAIDRYDANLKYERYNDFYHTFHITVEDRYSDEPPKRIGIDKDVLDIFFEGESQRDQIIEQLYAVNYDNIAYSEYDP